MAHWGKGGHFPAVHLPEIGGSAIASAMITAPARPLSSTLGWAPRSSRPSKASARVRDRLLAAAMSSGGEALYAGVDFGTSGARCIVVDGEHSLPQSH